MKTTKIFIPEEVSSKIFIFKLTPVIFPKKDKESENAWGNHCSPKKNSQISLHQNARISHFSKERHKIAAQCFSRTMNILHADPSQVHVASSATLSRSKFDPEKLHP